MVIKKLLKDCNKIMKKDFDQIFLFFFFLHIKNSIIITLIQHNLYILAYKYIFCFL